MESSKNHTFETKEQKQRNMFWS